MDDGGVGDASETSTECGVVGFQTLGWRGRYTRGERDRENDRGALERRRKRRRRKKRGRLVLVEQRVPLQRQMAPKERASETRRE